MNSDFVIGPDAELGAQKKELESFLYENVYRHPTLMAIRNRAQERLKEMYSIYNRNPEFFPNKYQERAQKIGIPRMAVEYIAGMTDHFCEQTFAEIKSNPAE